MTEFIIHRGTHQIGGMCAEIRTDNNRVMIDLGANLPGADNSGINSDDELVSHVFGKEQPVDAVLFTHYHGDHIGLLTNIPKSVENVYMGKTAKKIALAVAKRTDKVTKQDSAEVIDKMTSYEKNEESGYKTLNFGDIRVTPIPVGHSALDSYMFFIEAEGKTMLYTGDFRDHGIDGQKLYDNVKHTLVGRKLDVLVTEGTMLSRGNEDVITEKELSEKAKEMFGNNKYNFILMSSTNIDSIVSFYNALPEGMPFVCDDYQKEILEIVKEYGRENSKYDINMDNIKVIHHYDANLAPEHDKGFVMLVRARGEYPGMRDKFREYISKYSSSPETQLIYSMWDGYRQKDKPYTNRNIVNMLENFDENKIVPLHTSGHAGRECLKELIELTKPQWIIPMHSESTDKMKDIPDFAAYSDKIKVLFDGDVFDLGSNKILENIYYDICHFQGDKYDELAEMVRKKLNEDQANWTERFKRYADEGKFSEKEDFLKNYAVKPEIPENLDVYSPIGSGSHTIQLRHSGALIAHLTHQGSERGWEIYPEEAAKYFNVCDNGTTVTLKYYLEHLRSLNNGRASWTNEMKEKLKNIEINTEEKLVKEHKLESMIHTEIKNGSFLGLQPVFLVKTSDRGCRFQMPVPFTANKIATDKYFKYLKAGKGNIDILAKTKDGTLTVIELKDSYCEIEKPSESIKQAIIYATFLAKLINTNNAGNWKELFGKDIKTDEINAVICMPYSEKITNEDFSFAKSDIKIDDITIHLHYIYLDNDGKIKTHSFHC